MPPVDEKIFSKRDAIIEALRAILPPDCVVADEVGRRAYECDALTMYRQLPLVVVMPNTAYEVQAVLRLASSMGVNVVPRGGGTSLSGGSLPVADGILLSMTKFNRILEVDFDNRCVRTQPGVANLAVTKAVESQGFYYAPDPSSQIACSIGGNVSENAGGIHCLKYGLTTNNLLGLEIVLMSGELVRLGGKHLDSDLYDVMGLFTGAEGLLGVITEVTVRILAKPQSARGLLMGFPTVQAAGDCVAAIIGKGIIPAGLEMMDRASINAVEDFQACGYPRDVGSLLICELDGPRAEVDDLVEKVTVVANSCGASLVRTSNSEAERLQFWKGRKNAFPAVGAIGPDYLCMDGTIPRGQLSKVLGRMEQLSTEFGLRVANVFHAGDGNLHPLILYDASEPGQIELAESLGAKILLTCVEVGGVLTGEHGVGVEKRDLMCAMFNDDDLDQQHRLKIAFDPALRLNPGKVFPTLHRCAEAGKMHVHGSQLAFPDLPRF